MRVFILSFILYARFGMPQQLKVLSDKTRILVYVSAALMLIGFLAVVVHENTGGAWLFFASAAVLGAFMLRIDVLAKSILLESRMDQVRRLTYGATGFGVTFVYALVSRSGVTSLATWVLPAVVMFMIVGVMTIRSRMAIAFELIPAGAKERDVQALSDFYKDMLPEERDAERHRVAALEYTVGQDETMRSLGTWVYWFLYIFLALGAGAFVTGYYLYGFARPKGGRSGPADA